MSQRDLLIVAGALLILWMLTRQRSTGTTHATIYGATVAPGVDVTTGESSDVPNDYWWY